MLSEPDVLLLLDIYPASEAPLPGVTGEALYRAVRDQDGDHGGAAPVFVERVSDLLEALSKVVQDGDVVLTLGAGDIDSVALNFAAQS